ncbi:MAG: MFS transporter [Pseudomonadota bacterium]|nr:MFS transporter [Pseudomonadota bacterium]|tara:strand:- start:54016 stop:55239 length:1224 start_codon:yes stop_codon:yes gene_type:complete
MNVEKSRSIALYPIVLVIFEVIVYLSNDMYFPALPQISAEFSVSISSVQITLTAWFLGAASLNLVVGFISDYFGRKTVLILSAIIFMLSSVMCSLSGTLTNLALSRFFQGTAVASIAVAGWATVHELMSEDDAVRVISWMSSFTVIAPAFGPLVGAGLLLILPWQGLFSVLALASALALVAIVVYFPESNPKEKRRTVSVHLVLVDYWNILTNKTFQNNIISLSFVFSGTLAWLAACPFIIAQEFNGGPLTIGMVMLGVFVGFVVGSILIEKLIVKHSTQIISIIGLIVCLIASIALVIFNTYLTFNLALLTACMFIFSVGNGLSYSTLQKQGIESCKEPMGARMAIFSTMIALSAAFGSFMSTRMNESVSVSFSYFLIQISVIAVFIKIIGFLLSINRTLRFRTTS